MTEDVNGLLRDARSLSQNPRAGIDGDGEGVIDHQDRKDRSCRAERCRG